MRRVGRGKREGKGKKWRSDARWAWSQSRGQVLQGARSSRQQVDARDPYSSAPHQHAAYWTWPGGSCQDLPSQARPGLFRATKSAFWSQDSRRELTNSKTPKTVKMRAQGPRSRGLGPWVHPARELEAAAALCPRCTVRSGSVRCPGCRGVTASRAIRNESVSWGARLTLRAARRGALLFNLSVPLLLYHPALGSRHPR